MCSLKPAICLTPAILTGAQGVPKLLLGSANGKSQRKSGLQKTLLLLVVCSRLGEGPGCAEPIAAAALLNKEEAPLLQVKSFQINITDRIAFFPSNPMLCLAVLEPEEDFCFTWQCSPTADLLNALVVFPAKQEQAMENTSSLVQGIILSTS